MIETLVPPSWGFALHESATAFASSQDPELLELSDEEQAVIATISATPTEIAKERSFMGVGFLSRQFEVAERPIDVPHASIFIPRSFFAGVRALGLSGVRGDFDAVHPSHETMSASRFATHSSAFQNSL